MARTALILVDLQNDFMPGGALPAAGGDQVVPVLDGLLDHVDHVVATQDWHPADHGSFAAQHRGRSPGQVIDLHGLSQVLWPVHCVQGTSGADFVGGLRLDRVDHVTQKGTDPTLDSYSGFFDNGHRAQTDLADWLRDRGVDTVYVGGVATDYCVKFTAIDACQLGFRTLVVADACRGVNLAPGDIERAFADMAAAGATIISSAALTKR